ncbi:hypothetical protein [Sporosarcina psychrophila]|uniref:hypothetical protein n=1 Tax=Sporosarcina psychrophila TaxID=1476 RepID=UPI00078B7209|nr:hypothetical protein [Sporosarcina psychrophila]AMQ06418.1 hypothetical protein AZE41_11045 [Sporosarcina psychrophila]
MKKSILITVILSLLFMLGCNQKQKEDFVLLESNLTDEDSKLLFLDSNLKEIETKVIKSNGLTSLINDEEKLLSISPYKSEYITVSKDEIDITDSKLPHPLFMIPFNNEKMFVYNYDKENDMNYYTYKMEGRKGSEPFRLKGIPFSITSDKKSLFIYSRDFTEPIENQFTLSVVDTIDNSIVKELVIDGPLVSSDLSVHDNQLYISLVDMDNGDSYIYTLNLENWQLEIKKLKEKNILGVYIQKNNVYAIYSNSGKSLLIKYNNDFSKLLESTEIGYTIEKPKFSKDMMYFISNKDDNSTFLSFDLKKLKINNVTEIPSSIIDYVILSQ